MSQSYIQFLQDTYQALLDNPSFQDENLGSEEVIFDIMQLMSNVLAKCGVELQYTSFFIEMLESGSFDQTPQFAYIDCLRIDQTPFDLLGNIGKKHIIEGYLERHKPDAACSWIEKEDILENILEYGDPIDWPWMEFIERRIMAFHQGAVLDQKTPKILHSNRSIRI